MCCKEQNRTEQNICLARNRTYCKEQILCFVRNRSYVLLGTDPMCCKEQNLCVVRNRTEQNTTEQNRTEHMSCKEKNLL